MNRLRTLLFSLAAVAASSVAMAQTGEMPISINVSTRITSPPLTALALKEATDPGAPASGTRRLWVDSTGAIHLRGASGDVTVGVPDGDKGDITVSGSGGTFTIDDGAVTISKLASFSSDDLAGKLTNSTGWVTGAKAVFSSNPQIPSIQLGAGGATTIQGAGIYGVFGGAVAIGSPTGSTNKLLFGANADVTINADYILGASSLSVDETNLFTWTAGQTYAFPSVSATMVDTATTQTLTNKTISGAANTISNLAESALALTDNTTNNASTTKHGFLPKLDNSSAHYLDGQGQWTTPTVAISNPRVYYVRSTGNDTTGNGSATAPYQTADKAYTVGVAAAQNFAIDLGAGSYSLTLSANLTYLKLVRGQGAGGPSMDHVTYFNLIAKGDAGNNANGGNGHTVTLTVQTLQFQADVSGGDVTEDDGGTYTSGNSGDIVLSCAGDVIIASIYAQNGSGSGSVGTVNGGNAGTISLRGPFVLFNGNWGVSGQSNFNGSPGADGSIYVDGADVRGVSALSAGTLSLGRCSYTTGLTFNDQGGNAAW